MNFCVQIYLFYTIDLTIAAPVLLAIITYFSTKRKRKKKKNTQKPPAKDE